MDEEHCPESPTGEHAPNWATLQRVPDLVNVFDVECKHCGVCGSLVIEPGDDPNAEDVNW